MSIDLEDFRRYTLASDTRENFARSEQEGRAWKRAHPTTLDDLLAWIDSLRELFGDAPTDLEPWGGDDFRL